VLTLYTTPVVYLTLDKLRHKTILWWQRRPSAIRPALQ
jgi:hypothetical protein